MIKFENVSVMNMANAIRGMRNPQNSWSKADSYIDGCFNFIVGENDLQLAKKLVKAGTSHRKFMRQILVSVDITAPLYWWKEFDQYKVGVVTDSTSTMHSIHKKKFDFEDFSCENLTGSSINLFESVIGVLNANRELFLDNKIKKYWWQMIQLLPSSYNQMRTVTLNYEVLLNIRQSRKGHKLDEWNEFVQWADSLPYFKEFAEG